ncbi:MAG: DNA recombination protein RmuC [Pseudomonadota bacterium]|nr:DNA recombination protein RmuC [Pseudomonadota bacterium]
MVFEWLTPGLLAAVVVITLWIALRRPPADVSGERQARELRDEVTRSAQSTRQELGATLGDFQRTVLAQQGEVARTQNEQIDAFGRQLAATQQQLADSLGQTTSAQIEQARLARESLDATLATQGLRQTSSLRELADSLSQQLQALVRANDQRMGEVRASVETKLAAIQLDNEKKLEQIRATVDEKLHATLEHRLGESFRQVAERLEQVHRGIGEMQKLASDVGSLSRVLTNVKTRGIFGEVQLAALLEQALTLEQYATNVETVPGTGARVEFAIKLPGRRDDGAPLWLPIDCKFPREDYERLVEAQEAADRAGVEVHARAIETRLRKEALAIRDKYVSPPHTTDFGIMFLPTEGLYAEALRRPGLVESLQREYKVMLTGPTTLLATLSSLQMGFRTLALEKRTSEVWDTLSAVKTEFGKFGAALANTRKKLHEASKTIDDAEVRTRAVERSLRGVETLSDERAQALLPGTLFDDAGDA